MTTKYYTGNFLQNSSQFRQ